MIRSLLASSRYMMSFMLIAGVLLSGCASTGSNSLGMGAPAPDSRLTQGTDAQFFSKSGYQACAMGAGAAVLACVLSNPNNKAVCMIAAGVAACGVAMGANYYVDQRRSEYADTMPSELLPVDAQPLNSTPAMSMKDIMYREEANRLRIIVFLLVEACSGLRG